MWLCTTILNNTARKTKATTKKETLIKNNHQQELQSELYSYFPGVSYFTYRADEWKHVGYLIKVKTVAVYTTYIHLFKSRIEENTGLYVLSVGNTLVKSTNGTRDSKRMARCQLPIGICNDVRVAK